MEKSVEDKQGAIHAYDDSRYAEAIAVSARSFQEDPNYVYFMPDPVLRSQVLPYIKRAYMNVFPKHRHSFLFIGPDDDGKNAHAVKGVMLCTPPLGKDNPIDYLKDPTVFKVLWLLGVQSMYKLLYTLDRLDHMEHLVTADLRESGKGHCHLALLGVDTGYQGKGLGSSLLRYITADLDKKQAACYLETGNERNVQLYKRFGFYTVYKEHVCADPAAPVMHYMRRDPTAASPTTTTATKQENEKEDEEEKARTKVIERVKKQVTPLDPRSDLIKLGGVLALTLAILTIAFWLLIQLF